MIYEDAIEQVAKKLGLPKNLVNKTYRAYWKAVKEHITSIPFKEGLTDEEFEKAQPNVNVPSLGKLYVTLEKYRKIHNKIEALKTN